MAISFQGIYALNVENPDKYQYDAESYPHQDGELYVTTGDIVVPDISSPTGKSKANVLLINGQDAKDFANFAELNYYTYYNEKVCTFETLNSLAAKAVYLDLTK